MVFSLLKKPSLVENLSIVDALALTKKSTIEGFQCIGKFDYYYIVFTRLSVLVNFALSNKNMKGSYKLERTLD